MLIKMPYNSSPMPTPVRFETFLSLNIYFIWKPLNPRYKLCILMKKHPEPYDHPPYLNIKLHCYFPYKLDFKVACITAEIVLRCKLWQTIYVMIQTTLVITI